MLKMFIYFKLLLLVPGLFAYTRVRAPITPPPTTTHSPTEFNRTINVKTVLFTYSDTCKICWSPEELDLLVARRLVQDLIPKRIPKDFRTLLEYINTCVNQVKMKVPGKNGQTVLAALYDALGGYLYAVVVPILNEAYYAGNVDYHVTSQLHYLLGQMMTFLGTNGISWSNPCDMSRIPTRVASLPIRLCAEEDACKIFVLVENKFKKNVGMPVDMNNESMPACGTSDVKIQVPFLDDNSYPSAIAVPLKDHALFSLMSECSVNLIPKYYIMAMRCLSSSQYTTRDMVNFNHKLYQWLISTVVPHLHDLDRWYPGFGSVMRVIETMNRRGLASTDPIKPNVKAPQYNTSYCFGKQSCGLDQIFTKQTEGCFPLLYYTLLALGILVGAVLLLCCLRCLYCRFIKRRTNEDAANTLVSLYCGLRDASVTGEEKSKAKRSGSKTYATISSYTATTSEEGSE